MSSQLIIGVLLFVIVIMVVAGVYYLFFASPKKSEDLGISPDANIVRARVASMGDKVAFLVDSEDLYSGAVPDLRDLTDTNPEPKNLLEQAVRGEVPVDKRDLVYYMLETTMGITINVPYDREKGRREYEAKQAEGESSAAEAVTDDEPEKDGSDKGGSDGGSTGGNVPSGTEGAGEEIDEKGEGSFVDPLTGVSVTEEESLDDAIREAQDREQDEQREREAKEAAALKARQEEEARMKAEAEARKKALAEEKARQEAAAAKAAADAVPEGEGKGMEPEKVTLTLSDGKPYTMELHFDREKEKDADGIVTLMGFVAESMLKSVIAPELAQFAQERFRVTLDPALWDAVKTLRASSHKKVVEKFEDCSLEEFTDLVYESVEKETRRQEEGDENGSTASPEGKINLKNLVISGKAGKHDLSWNRLQP